MFEALVLINTKTLWYGRFSRTERTFTDIYVAEEPLAASIVEMIRTNPQALKLAE